MNGLCVYLWCSGRPGGSCCRRRFRFRLGFGRLFAIIVFIQKFRQLCFIWPDGLGSGGRGGRARSADHRSRQMCGQMRVFLARLRLQVFVPRPWSWSCRRACSEKERKSFAHPVLGWTISVAKIFCPIGLDILWDLLDIVFVACLNHFDKFWLRAKIF